MNLILGALLVAAIAWALLLVRIWARCTHGRRRDYLENRLIDHFFHGG